MMMGIRQVKQRWLVLLLVLVIVKLEVAKASTCSGRMLNPISDICWRCLLPISIGPVSVGKGTSPAKRDTKNPSSPVCGCMRGKPPVLVPGISLGFWEPARVIEVTRVPHCMVTLGGMQLGSPDLTKSGSTEHHYGKGFAHHSFYHLHYYIYPVIYVLQLITDLICLEKSGFDIAYMSEYDPSWNDHKLQNLLNPEGFLFGNVALQAACALDCAAATIDKPRDELHWCSGCWGNMFPLSGANADYEGGVQSSSLYATRILAKMHKAGLARKTATSSSKINGELCKSRLSPIINKSQYKLQMVYPRPTSGELSCFPLGLSDLLYSSWREYPMDGQDWGYLVWRKKNCCCSG